MTDEEAILQILDRATVGPVVEVSRWKDHVGSTCRLYRVKVPGRDLIGKVSVGVERHERAVRELQVLETLGRRWPRLAPVLVGGGSDARSTQVVLVLEQLQSVRRVDEITLRDLEAIFEAMSQAWRIGPEDEALAGLELPRWGHGGRGEHPHRRRARRLARRGEVMLKRFPPAAGDHGSLLSRIIERFNAIATPCLDRPMRVVHGDLHRDNIVFTRDGPRILDWQTCSLGDPVHDVTRLAMESEPGLPFEAVRALCDLQPASRAESSVVARSIILTYAGFVTGLAGRPELAAETPDHRFTQRMLDPRGVASTVTEALDSLELG